MNSKEIKQHDAEQEQIARALDAKKRKKRLIRLAVTVGAALVVLVALYLILRRCGSGERPSYSYDPLSEDNGEGFVSQSVDFDIFTDEEYADKDLGVNFYADNVGEYFTVDDLEYASYQARLFVEYFDAAIRGDGKKLNTLFTDEYFENDGRPIKKYPDRFPMQKIYAIKVEKTGVGKTENTVEGTMIYEYYKVSFLLKDNNGAFRPDLVPTFPSPTAAAYR
jgi:hypothetical protein